VNKGNFRILKMIPIPVTLKPNMLLYTETVESILCLDQARQFYLMLTEDNVKERILAPVCASRINPRCLAIPKSCAVKRLQSRDSCETRTVQLSSAVWIQLLSNEWTDSPPLQTVQQRYAVTRSLLMWVSVSLLCVPFAANTASLRKKMRKILTRSLIQISYK
jgi:hypothetical protein